MVRPGEPDRLLDDPLVRDWNRRDDYMPYWAYLWPGALLLAEVVAREPWPAVHEPRIRSRALEIGCGVGLAGLVALSPGMHVCFSDYDLAPLHFVSQSARENGFDPSSFTTQASGLARAVSDETYPLILGSDVLYERRLVPLVAGLLARMLAPGGLGLISCPAGLRRGLSRCPGLPRPGLPRRVHRSTFPGQRVDRRTALPSATRHVTARYDGPGSRSPFPPLAREGGPEKP